MFSIFDPLIDYSCPYCQESLRWRRVKKYENIGQVNLCESYNICPCCNEKIIEQRHDAFANNWLWTRFYLLGVILCAIDIFIPTIAWILPYSVVVLIIGLISLIVYMISQRWNWKVYAKVDINKL